jgi:hypothetical protein
MPELDINSATESIQSKIQASKTYLEVSQAGKDLVKNAADSASKSTTQLTSQLNKIKDQQKRFQRDPPNSMSQMLGFLNQIKGSGSGTSSYILKKLLEIAARIEPKLAGIIKEETIKALGCSIEQTFKGTDPATLQSSGTPGSSGTPMSLLPQAEGIYIPVSSVDLFSNLKQSPETDFGKIFYEKEEPSADSKFRPYGGDVAFPMNKQLYTLMTQNNQGRSFSQINGQNYLGKSGQNLFDVQYSNTNNFGVTGDYYRVILLNRTNDSGNIGNQVGEFLSDYYSSIKLVDNVDISANIINIISGAISINLQPGFGQLEQATKFELLIQRILGLCFDDRREIDVSGIAKIAELDGVDDSFYELTEVDLRNIQVKISNIQNGVMEFEDCNNIKLPVDSESLVSQLIEFRESTGKTVAQQVAFVEQMIDSISENPNWKLAIPSNFDVKVSINTNVIKQIPLAVAASVLSPKVLLPLYTLLSVVQSGATYTYNQAITSATTSTQSTNTPGNAGANVNEPDSNIVTNASDFLKVYKSFSIQVISRVNAEFLKALFEILKAEIINLMAEIIIDLAKERYGKKIAMILRLIEIALIVSQLIDDYRKCKNLLDNILLLLTTIGQLIPAAQPEIPLPLLALAGALPGISATQMTMKAIAALQGVGMPTGPMPDGSPNLMLQFNSSSNKSIVSNITEDGKVYTVGLAVQSGKFM